MAWNVLSPLPPAPAGRGFVVRATQNDSGGRECVRREKPGREDRRGRGGRAAGGSQGEKDEEEDKKKKLKPGAV